MAHLLTITNKLFSLRGSMSINDEAGKPLYDAKGEFAFFAPTWRIYQSENEVASIRRELFAWAPTWHVGGSLGAFQIKRKLWSWVRQYHIVGGPFDGAEIRGNMWDLKFEITHDNKSLAHATGKILTLRDTHSIEVTNDDPEATLVTVIAMVTLLMDRQRTSNQHSS